MGNQLIDKPSLDVDNFFKGSHEEENVPLGILLSEEFVKPEINSAIPTSAYWTGGPDSKWPDSDR